MGLHKIDQIEEKYNNSNSFTTLSYINPRKTGGLEAIKKFEESKFLTNPAKIHLMADSDVFYRVPFK